MFFVVNTTENKVYLILSGTSKHVLFSVHKGKNGKLNQQYVSMNQWKRDTTQVC